MAPAKRELVFSYPQRSLQRYKYEDVCVCVCVSGGGVGITENSVRIPWESLKSS